MIHATYITNMHLEKETAFSIPQLDLKFLADINSWDVN